MFHIIRHLHFSFGNLKFQFSEISISETEIFASVVAFQSDIFRGSVVSQKPRFACRCLVENAAVISCHRTFFGEGWQCKGWHAQSGKWPIFTIHFHSNFTCVCSKVQFWHVSLHMYCQQSHNFPTIFDETWYNLPRDPKIRARCLQRLGPAFGRSQWRCLRPGKNAAPGASGRFCENGGWFYGWKIFMLVNCLLGIVVNWWTCIAWQNPMSLGWSKLQICVDTAFVFFSKLLNCEWTMMIIKPTEIGLILGCSTPLIMFLGQENCILVGEMVAVSQRQWIRFRMVDVVTNPFNDVTSSGGEIHWTFDQPDSRGKPEKHETVPLGRPLRDRQKWERSS